MDLFRKSPAISAALLLGAGLVLGAVFFAILTRAPSQETAVLSGEYSEAFTGVHDQRGVEIPLHETYASPPLADGDFASSDSDDTNAFADETEGFAEEGDSAAKENDSANGDESTASLPAVVETYQTPVLAADDPVFNALVPYEATYRVEIDWSHYNNQYASLFGTFVYRTESTCSGWLVHVSRDLQIAPRGASGVIEANTVISQWMATDGTSFRFFEQTKSNGQTISLNKGIAARSSYDGRGRVVYSLPDKGQQKIPANTVFSPFYTFLELKATREGKPAFFTLATYNPDDQDSPLTYHAITLGEKTIVENDTVKKAFPDAKDRNGRHITVAEFDSDRSSMIPQAVIKKVMLDNGIETFATIETPTDTQRITLEKLTLLPRPACASP